MFEDEIFESGMFDPWTQNNPPAPAWGQVEGPATSFERSQQRPPAWAKSSARLFDGAIFDSAVFDALSTWTNQTPPAPSWATE